ncbi:MAG: hypothetical protein AAF658_20610 [Myxococcota bacterium]
MKNAAFGLFLGILVTCSAWWSASTLAGPKSAVLPQEYGEMHEIQGLDPAALRSIQAFKSIANSLEAGTMSGVRENALTIADFFAPMNVQIKESALALAEDTEVESAKAHFRELTKAFQHPATGSGPQQYEL